MANVSLANLVSSGFDISGDNVSFGRGISGEFYSWDWTTYYAPLNRSAFIGADLEFLSNKPSAGKFTALTLDLDFENSRGADISIKNLLIEAAPFSQLQQGVNQEANNDLYWRLVLAGDDTVDLGTRAAGTGTLIHMAGDGRHVEAAQVLIGGRDMFIGNGPGALADGDYHTVLSGGTAYGGNDVMSIGGYLESGDAYSVYGFLSGGNDRLSVQVGGSLAYIVGDANQVFAGGVGIGGSDVIDGGGVTQAVAGDFRFLDGNAVCGDDQITGGNAGELLIGDIITIHAGGSARGGSDTIHGGGGSDTIYGDWQTIDAGAIGKGGDDFLYGDAGNDTIYGNGGNDLLDGGTDIDKLIGGEGNDKYRIDNTGDVVVEGKDEGTADVILSKVNYTLGKGVYVEFLQTNSTLGTASIDLVGNELSQTIIGNAGVNRLSDGDGAGDVLKGLGGSDIYRIASPTTTIVEGKDGGAADVVLASTSYVLGEGVYVEFLQTDSNAGTGGIFLTGNELAQTITGNAGHNNLSDGGGAGDVLRGLGSNDRYEVASAATTIIEGKSEGASDIVVALVSFKLNAGAYVEYLVCDGGDEGNRPVDLSGNEFAQTIIGNLGANRLDGKGGADVLKGDEGKDTFVFSTALNLGVDTINDFTAVDDTIELSKSVFTALSLGTLSTSAFRANTTGLAGDASDRIIYETDTGKLFYDADGTGTEASGIHFATLNGLPTITNADFVVV